MAMPGGAHRHAGVAVEKHVAVHIGNPYAAGPLDDQWIVAGIGRGHKCRIRVHHLPGACAGQWRSDFGSLPFSGRGHVWSPRFRLRVPAVLPASRSLIELTTM